jgi:hypothetical protein
MAIAPAIKPQETKPAPLPAYPVAAPSHTQTSARGMVMPKGYASGTPDVPPANGSNRLADAINTVTPQGQMVGGFTSAFGKAMSDAASQVPSPEPRHYAEGGFVGGLNDAAEAAKGYIQNTFPAFSVNPSPAPMPVAPATPPGPGRFNPASEGSAIGAVGPAVSNFVHGLDSSATPVTAQRFAVPPAAPPVANTEGGMGT